MAALQAINAILNGVTTLVTPLGPSDWKWHRRKQNLLRVTE